MGKQLLVDTEQVGIVASKLDDLKTQLDAKLKETEQVVDNLVGGDWEGEAANKTLQSYQEFVNTYSARYNAVISNYIHFLRTSVQSGYWETESANMGRGQAFA